MVKCPSCGKERSENDIFCDGPDGCGFPLLAKQQEKSPEAAAIGQIQCPNTSCGRMNSASSSFCYYCGAALGQVAGRRPPVKPAVSARLVAGKGQIQITENPMWLRRDHFAGILPDEHLSYISRQHCIIGFEDGSYYIEDSGSLNNTWLNGKKIRGEGRLKLVDGDEINVAGVISLTFKAQ